MYFDISLFPSSRTSGVLPPARVASNFWRCVFHVWYCTFTFVSGCFLANAALAALTAAGQPDCASTWSHTVMLLACALLLAPSVVPAVSEAATTARRDSATVMRLFIWNLPESGGPLARFAPRGGCAKYRAPQVGQYHMPRGGSWHSREQVVNTKAPAVV